MHIFSFSAHIPNNFHQGVTASEYGIISATEPVFAAVFAALMLGESLTADIFKGGSLVIGACLVAQADIEKIMRRFLVNIRKLFTKKNVPSGGFAGVVGGAGGRRRLLSKNSNATYVMDDSLSEEETLIVQTAWDVQEVVHNWRRIINDITDPTKVDVA